jgi:UDPglucose 6-dehydrogenase
MVGAGYVGLVSSVCFAEFGHQVVCIDSNAARIDELNAGKLSIYEPGLESAVAENRREGRLAFSTDLAAAVRGSDAVFIAVGTPARRGDGKADLSFVHAVAREIAPALSGYTVVVTKSTVPVGTGDQVEAIIRAARPEADFSVGSNPEFLREGSAIEDFKHPNRIVVGTIDERAREVMRAVYRPLYLNQAPILFTDRRTAELIKYASNAFLATKIAFINEIADLCEKTGANVQDVARGMGLDNRIGQKFLNPGPGFGGSCLPKDLNALLGTAAENGVELGIVAAASAGNVRRKRALADRVAAALGGSLAGRTVAVLGLTFKPNTDDMREAPSLVLVPDLLAAGATVRAFDPKGIEPARSLLPAETVFAADPYDCATGADVLVLLTEWESFRALDLVELRARMRRSVMVDFRNIYPPAEIRARGFAYHSMGRALLDGGASRQAIAPDIRTTANGAEPVGTASGGFDRLQPGRRPSPTLDDMNEAERNGWSGDA